MYNKINNSEIGIYLDSSIDDIIQSNSFSNNEQDIKENPKLPKVKAPVIEILIVIFILFIAIILIFKKKNKK